MVRSVAVFTLVSCPYFEFFCPLGLIGKVRQTDFKIYQSEVIWGLGQLPDCLCGQIYFYPPQSTILHDMGVEGNPTKWEH